MIYIFQLYNVHEQVKPFDVEKQPPYRGRKQIKTLLQGEELVKKPKGTY